MPNNMAPVDCGTCYRCGEPMWMSRATYETYYRNHQTFYCTHGHPQCYAEGKSQQQKLQEQLDAERLRRQRAEQRVAEKADEAEAAWATATKERNRANGYKGHATRITKRAKAGLCPCCKRSFENLRRHMATKHPQFTPLEVIEGGKAANG